MKTIALILTISIISSAQIIGLDSNSTANASSNTSYSDLALNLSNLDAATYAEIQNCIVLLNDSNVFLESLVLTAAV
jgi:hypothetical protein